MSIVADDRAGASEPDDWSRRREMVEQVFSAAPIPETSYSAGAFAGRMREIHKGLDAIQRESSHVVIFGAFGIGKTSLANVLTARTTSPAQSNVIRVECHNTDDFTSVWQRVFSQLHIRSTVGFRRANDTSPQTAPLPPTITPDVVRKVLSTVTQPSRILIAIDDFDRLPSVVVKGGFADCLKTLSNNLANVTLLLIGAADSVERLLADHQSIHRSLEEIHLPRLSQYEVKEIIRHGIGLLGLSIDDDALSLSSVVSQGLPTMARRLSRLACLGAIDRRSPRVSRELVVIGIRALVDDFHSTMDGSHIKAHAQRDLKYRQFMLACSMAHSDQFGYFGVEEILGSILGLKTKLASVNFVNSYVSRQSGPPLLNEKGGRFRFEDPLLQPIIVMWGFMLDEITTDMLRRSQVGDVGKLLDEGEESINASLRLAEIPRFTDADEMYERAEAIRKELSDLLQIDLGSLTETQRSQLKRFERNLDASRRGRESASS